MFEVWFSYGGLLRLFFYFRAVLGSEQNWKYKDSPMSLMPPFCLFLYHFWCYSSTCYIQASVYIRHGTESKVFSCLSLHFFLEIHLFTFSFSQGAVKPGNQLSFMRDKFLFVIYLFFLSCWIPSTFEMELSGQSNFAVNEAGRKFLNIFDWNWCLCALSQMGHLPYSQNYKKMSLELALIL